MGLLSDAATPSLIVTGADVVSVSKTLPPARLPIQGVVTATVSCRLFVATLQEIVTRTCLM